MEETLIFEALKLLVVGMITVFAILMIVIYFGKGLILLVNKYVPAQEQTPKSVANTTAVVDANTKAVIDAAVNQITAGNGRVVKITKM